MRIGIIKRTRPSPSPRRQRMALYMASGASAVLLVAVYLLELIVAERNWLTTLVTYAPQHIFAIPLVALLVWALVVRDWRAVAVNAAVGTAFVFTLLGFNVPLDRASASGGRTVRLMTYNIHHSEAGGPLVAEVVARVEPDIICLQEANALLKWSDGAREIERLYPKWDRMLYGELAIFSRYPMVSRRLHQLDPVTGRQIIDVTLDVHGRRLSVFNIHLPNAADAESISSDSKALSRHLRGTEAIRSQNAARVLQFAADVKGPLVIAGDFNTPPRGHIYRSMTRNYADAFGAAGFGTGFTFRSSLPVLRIDHVLVRPGVGVVNARVLNEHASDHLPLVVDLKLPD